VSLIKLEWNKSLLIVTFNLRDGNGWVVPPTLLWRASMGYGKITLLAIPFFQLLFVTSN
jgi:hypothetical protein